MKFLKLSIFMALLNNAYHQYVFKYKMSATIYEISNQIKTGSSEMSNVSSEHP